MQKPDKLFHMLNRWSPKSYSYFRSKTFAFKQLQKSCGSNNEDHHRHHHHHHLVTISRFMSIGFVICMPPLGVLPQFASYLARGLLVIVIVMNDVLQLDMSVCLVEWNGYLELPLMHIKYSKAIHPSVCPSDHLSFNLSIPIPITLEPVVRMIGIVGAYIGDWKGGRGSEHWGEHVCYIFLFAPPAYTYFFNYVISTVLASITSKYEHFVFYGAFR